MSLFDKLRFWRSESPKVVATSGSFWNAAPPPNEEERAAWRLWMRHVLMPINARIESVIVGGADLLEGAELPGCLLDLLAHIAAYKAVSKAWEDGDHSRHVSVIDYPEEVNRYVKREYLKLKALQQTLIGPVTSDAQTDRRQVLH